MCLGVPGKIIEKYEQNSIQMGIVDFGGVTREVCLAYVPEVETNDYVLIHVGFALNVISEEEAHETLELLREIANLVDEIPAAG
jgi:hydrogenase expression/formation protein HypC